MSDFKRSVRAMGWIEKEKLGTITKSERNVLFSYFRHIPNSQKTDEEWEIYCKMAKEKGIADLNRTKQLRPIHEKI